MGFFDAVGDLLSAAMPWSEVEAEAPPKEEEEKVCLIFFPPFVIPRGASAKGYGDGELWSLLALPSAGGWSVQLLVANDRMIYRYIWVIVNW